jgi:hypothetical protein
MNALSSTLQSLHIGCPITHAGLTMFPLVADRTSNPDYLLLDQVLDGALAEVSEVSDAGSVPELQFRNKADKDVLLVDGEELVGAKQNRVLNLTILVSAGKTVKIPVSCVEAGRWAWRSTRFAAGKRKLHAKARIEKMARVSRSMEESGERARSDVQAAVWRSVDDKMASLACRSETSSLHDVYDSSEARLGELRRQFEAVSGQVGAVFYVAGQPVGCEVYDSAETLAHMLPRLVDSYALDAIEEARGDAKPPTLEQVKRILERIAGEPAQSYPAIDKGQDLRIQGESLQAAALVEGDRLLHLSAFVEERA